MLEKALVNLELSVIEETFRKFLESKQVERAKGTAQLCALLYQEWKKEESSVLALKEKDILDSLNIGESRTLRNYRNNLEALGLVDSSVSKVSSEIIFIFYDNFFKVIVPQTERNDQTAQKNAQKIGSDRPANEYSLNNSKIKIEKIDFFGIDEIEGSKDESIESIQRGILKNPAPKGSDLDQLINDQRVADFSTKVNPSDKINSEADSDHDLLISGFEKELDQEEVQHFVVGPNGGWIPQKVSKEQQPVAIFKQPVLEKVSPSSLKDKQDFCNTFRTIVYQNHAKKGIFDEHQLINSSYLEEIILSFNSFQDFKSYCEALAKNDLLMGRKAKKDGGLFEFNAKLFLKKETIEAWKSKTSYFTPKPTFVNDPATDYSKYKKQEQATQESYERIPDSVAEDYANKQDAFTFDGWFKKELYSLFKQNDRIAEYISWFVDKNITFKVEIIPFMYDGRPLEEEFLHIEAHPFRRDNVQRRFYTELEQAFEKYFETYFKRKPYRNKGLDVSKIKKA